MKVQTFNIHTAKVMSYEGFCLVIFYKGKMQTEMEPSRVEDLCDFYARAIILYSALSEIVSN